MLSASARTDTVVFEDKLSSGSFDLRCPRCNKLLGKRRADGLVELSFSRGRKIGRPLEYKVVCGSVTCVCGLSSRIPFWGEQGASEAKE